MTFENFNNYAKFYTKRDSNDNFVIKDKYKPSHKGEILKAFLKDFINKKTERFRTSF